MTTPERWQCLCAHHVEHLPHRIAELLVLWALGYSPSEASEHMGIESSTVENHADRARSVVPPTLTATRDNARAWAHAHRECCLATEWRRLALGSSATDRP
jgi:hypothetical protein